VRLELPEDFASNLAKEAVEMSLWDKHQDRSMTFDILYTYIIIYIIIYLGNPL
jgi:hypothetical protein